MPTASYEGAVFCLQKFCELSKILLTFFNLTRSTNEGNIFSVGVIADFVVTIHKLKRTLFVQNTEL